jgi:2-iminobutanoate/2-iminopropanoate deaminase
MKRIIEAEKAPKPIGPYSQAVEVGNLVYLSGQVAINPETSTFMNDDVATQTEWVMKNIGEVLKCAGLEFSNIIKTTIFLTDMNNFKAVNEVYAKYFETDFPARETVAVLGLPLGALVEISVIASKQ